MSDSLPDASLADRLARMAAWCVEDAAYTRRCIADDLAKLARECEGIELPPQQPTAEQIAAAEAAFAHVFQNFGATLASPHTLALRAALRAAFTPPRR